MTQRDANIHMTGLPEVQNAPRAFLMDGIAYPKGASTEPAAPAPVKLYDGVRSNDTELMVTLRRPRQDRGAHQEGREHHVRRL